jgi:hypothetical protein
VATLLNQASAVQTTGGVSPDLSTQGITTLEVNVDVTAVVSVSLTLFVEGKAADGNWYPLWSSSAIVAAGETSTSIGPGTATEVVLTGTIRFRWALTGTSATFSASIEGR